MNASKVISVTFNLNCGLHASFCWKTVWRDVKFLDCLVLKTESEPVFSTPLISTWIEVSAVMREFIVTDNTDLRNLVQNTRITDFWSTVVLWLFQKWLETINAQSAPRCEVCRYRIHTRKCYRVSFCRFKLNYYYLGGCIGVVVEYRTRDREVAGSTHTWSTASNLEQVANSASYPQQDGKWLVVAQLLWTTGWRHCVADRGNGASASCTVGPIVR